MNSKTSRLCPSEHIIEILKEIKSTSVNNVTWIDQILDQRIENTKRLIKKLKKMILASDTNNVFFNEVDLNLDLNEVELNGVELNEVELNEVVLKDIELSGEQCEKLIQQIIGIAHDQSTGYMELLNEKKKSYAHQFSPDCDAILSWFETSHQHLVNYVRTRCHFINHVHFKYLEWLDEILSKDDMYEKKLIKSDQCIEFMDQCLKQMIDEKKQWIEKKQSINATHLSVDKKITYIESTLACSLL